MGLGYEWDESQPAGAFETLGFDSLFASDLVADELDVLNVR